VIINLLETALYHSDVCESADDAITDFIEYLYRKLAYLASRYARRNRLATFSACFIKWICCNF